MRRDIIHPVDGEWIKQLKIQTMTETLKLGTFPLSPEEKFIVLLGLRAELVVMGKSKHQDPQDGNQTAD